MREVAGERLIDVSAIRRFMRSHSAQPIVLAGCAMNQGELDVDCTILLTASTQTMQARIADRENPFGKDEATWRKILADKVEFEPTLRARCDLVIDTDRPLDVTEGQFRRLLEEDFTMGKPVHFCTCSDTACPFNPVNHDQGCTPCIAKNLKEREIPTCFFKAVGHPKPTSEWHFEDFAALVCAAMERKSE